MRSAQAEFFALTRSGSVSATFPNQGAPLPRSRGKGMLRLRPSQFDPKLARFLDEEGAAAFETNSPDKKGHLSRSRLQPGSFLAKSRRD